jgi:biotin carboxyl carrier protein
MRITSTVNQQTFVLDVEGDERDENLYRLKMDGEEFTVKIVELKPDSATVSINDWVGFFEYRRDRGRLKEVITENKAYQVSAKTPQQDELERLLDAFAAGLDKHSAKRLITAPMPGKILKVYVKRGERVDLGKVVVVLEAMKMENDIASDVDGVVREVKVKEGDVVAIDQPLVEFEEE